jgi:hypothetical protein
VIDQISLPSKPKKRAGWKAPAYRKEQSELFDLSEFQVHDPARIHFKTGNIFFAVTYHYQVIDPPVITG